ncbi:hypothetical protein ABD76_01045 [Paenibacillus dendritiformis]|uniref:EamA family transporter n=1 Tax=Paenibacillus dendritiformis TaxID=130049 RepID=UPI0018CE29E8|nr:EamA family transporter [Paenibacillus dendritiformis]MBG9791185.1 hypothetical protein [Paenibacillus dendritiformis]
MELLKSKHAGKALMILSAWCTATGQLFWKWGIANLLYLGIGFVFYGIGAVLMIKSLSLEKLSVAYPLMACSYIFALLYGGLLLGETVNLQKGIAVLLLIIGVACISYEK